MDRKNNSNQIWSEVDQQLPKNLANILLAANDEPEQASPYTVGVFQIEDRRTKIKDAPSG
jgi:hypothetical protein